MFAVAQVILPGNNIIPADPDVFKPRHYSDGFELYVSIETLAKAFQDTLRPCKATFIAFTLHLIPPSVWDRIVSTIPDPNIEEDQNKFRAVKF